MALASAKTVKTLMETEDRNVATLAFVLMFIRVHMYFCKLEISASTCPGNFHMVVNDLHYFHKGVCSITKRNYLAASVALIFLVYRKDVKETRRVTSEPGEHAFGSVVAYVWACHSSCTGVVRTHAGLLVGSIWNIMFMCSICTGLVLY
jgi:hypothetical protein